MPWHDRAAIHAASGDPRRLLIVDQPTAGDLTVAELAELVAMPGSVLPHHLAVLTEEGLTTRRISEGDHRPRYASGALWHQDTGGPASSAGADPADQVHPKAVRMTGEYGVDIARLEHLAGDPRR